MNLRFPFEIGGHSFPRQDGRKAAIHQQLEQLLFTLPGERVGRPDFGCGVQRLVFEGAGSATASHTEYIISRAIQLHMRGVVRLDAVRVSTDDSTLYIDILYTVLDSGEELAASFDAPLGGPR